MNAKRTTRFLSIVVLFTFLLTACVGASEAEVEQAVQSGIKTALATQPATATATPDWEATAKALMTKPADQVKLDSPAATSTLPAPADSNQNAGNGNPPPASCKEQMMGPFQPPQNDYWYIQVTNEDFPDDDELFSISWTKNVTLSEWLVQDGGTTTEIVGVVRGSIQEVQFYHPTSGVYWRLCAHPDVQLANEIQLHAESIAAERNWLKVYNVGDLWMSLQMGDPELIALIKCITPSTMGIPSCQTP